jgi:hypothetical protein
LLLNVRHQIFHAYSRREQYKQYHMQKLGGYVM